MTVAAGNANQAEGQSHELHPHVAALTANAG